MAIINKCLAMRDKQQQLGWLFTNPLSAQSQGQRIIIENVNEKCSKHTHTFMSYWTLGQGRTFSGSGSTPTTKEAEGSKRTKDKQPAIVFYFVSPLQTLQSEGCFMDNACNCIRKVGKKGEYY